MLQIVIMHKIICCLFCDVSFKFKCKGATEYPYSNVDVIKIANGDS